MSEERRDEKNQSRLQGFRWSGGDDDSAIGRKNNVWKDADLEEEKREFGF